jgi:hypothetical protein
MGCLGVIFDNPMQTRVVITTPTSIPKNHCFLDSFIEKAPAGN